MKYYSEVTHKTYNTVEELDKAEKIENEKLASFEKKKEERGKRAAEIEDAYKKASEATKEADNLMKAFLKDYGAFHTSIRREPEVESMFERIFNFPFLF